MCQPDSTPAGISVSTCTISRPGIEDALCLLDVGVVRRAGVEPFSELADWDIFVLPSRKDPCPLAVLEAMAMRLPVVASRVGRIPEQLGERAGPLIEPQDPEGLAEAVTRLIYGAELRATSARQGAAAWSACSPWSGRPTASIRPTGWLRHAGRP